MTNRLPRRGQKVVNALFLLMSFVILAGCSSVSPPEQFAPASDLSQLARQVRPADPNREPFTFSNEARAIEEDLGVGRKTHASVPDAE
ncbi:hypothetical protein [Thermogutta sp.]|jgi:hypothetical protein|uniref:hypothetical protein n=1 Tax=Thermogutta sp. TaxID=1962930 RepID=UPI00321FC4BA